MGAVHALRPGQILGVYPERQVPSEGRFDRLIDQSAGALRGVFRRRANRFRPSIARIAALAGSYEALDEAGLAAATLEARRALRVKGLDDEVCARTFALIRERARRVLGLWPHEVQLLGGWAMLHGMVAEMETGEGKTLTACLPAVTAALAGIPVHVVTVNDYLVARDAEWMRPLYESLGLRVGTVVDGMSHQGRAAAYQHDIVYCTNKQLAFDYLRDRMVRGAMGGLRMGLDGLFGEQSIAGKLLLRGLCFAIVDEADSVLVDEARTPLIISRGGDGGEQEIRYREALCLSERLGPGADYRLRELEREVELTDAGREHIARLAASLGSWWRARRRREELVRQALFARTMLAPDRHYLVKDGKVQIVDEYTGRLMPDRSWERGLHQLVEVKEGLATSAQTEPLARISYQRFFRRYLRLAGMTGTAREIIGELWSVYHLEVLTVPTHRPVRRRDRGGRVYAGAGAKWHAVVARVDDLHRRGQPVLVGTASVAMSEHLSALLDAAGIPHRLLNARQDQDEATLIAQAGRRGAVTVATNMAGRGTDIKLASGVAELGGLEVLATERYEAGRIDRQLFGRCGRQGDPGAFGYIVSLEDDLIRNGGCRALARMLLRVRAGNVGWPGRVIVHLSQRGAERRHAKTRRQLVSVDDRAGRLLAFSGPME